MKIRKTNKAQAMVVIFTYISVVSLMGIYLMVYAGNLHKSIIRNIQHSKAFYAGEAALMRFMTYYNREKLYPGQPVPSNTIRFDPISVNVQTQVVNAGQPDEYIRIIATVRNWRR